MVPLKLNWGYFTLAPLKVLVTKNNMFVISIYQVNNHQNHGGHRWYLQMFVQSYQQGLIPMNISSEDLLLIDY